MYVRGGGGAIKILKYSETTTNDVYSDIVEESSPHFVPKRVGYCTNVELAIDMLPHLWMILEAVWIDSLRDYCILGINIVCF